MKECFCNCLFCYLMAEWVAKLFWTIRVSAYIERRPGKQKILKTHRNAFFGMHNDAVYFCIVQNNFLTWHVINGGSREEVSNKNFRKVKVWDFSLCHLHVLKIENASLKFYHLCEKHQKITPMHFSKFRPSF